MYSLLDHSLGSHVPCITRWMKDIRFIYLTNSISQAQHHVFQIGISEVFPNVKKNQIIQICQYFQKI